MPLIVSCSSCQKKLTVADQAAGQRVKCPQCGQAVAVAARPSAPAAVRPAAPAGAAVLTTACPGCARPVPYRPDMAGKLLKCPGCGKGVRVPGAATAPPKPVVQDDWIDITEEYLPPAGGGSPAGSPTGDWGQGLLQKHDVPTKMQEEIRSTMSESEKLVWCDRPQMDILMARARKQRFVGVLLILILTPLMSGLAWFIAGTADKGGAGAWVGVGVIVFMMVVFDALGVFLFFTPGRVQRNAANRSCYVLSNRRLLVHPGSGVQTHMSQGGTSSSTVVNAEQYGVASYAGLDLQRMVRIEEKNFPGSGDLVFGSNLLDNPSGPRMTALANVVEVEKMLRGKLLHPIVDKLLRGDVLLRDAFGKPKPKEKEEDGEILPTEGNIKTFMTQTGDGGAKAALQKELAAVSAEDRERVKTELTDGENVLWIGSPEGSTQGRGLLGSMVGSAKRKEPEYELYAITNRRVMLWARRGSKVGDTVSFGAAEKRGPMTYYPPSLLDAGLEEDKRIPKGGSIVFKSVKVTITHRDKQGKTTRQVENHYFGVLRVRNYQTVARVLFDTLIRPCRTV